MKRRRLISILFCFCLILTLGSCAFLSSKVKSIKGELIGNNFVIDFYDNFGNDILTINGNKVGIEANYVKTKSVDSEGDSITNYESSSVITITVDGHSIPQTGNTVIFAEKGNQDPFWNNSASNLLVGLIGFFLEEYKDGKIERSKITMTSIKKFQNSSMEDFRDISTICIGNSI